jgi:hypothetical protein
MAVFRVVSEESAAPGPVRSIPMGRSRGEALPIDRHPYAP